MRPEVALDPLTVAGARPICHRDLELCAEGLLRATPGKALLVAEDAVPEHFDAKSLHGVWLHLTGPAAARPFQAAMCAVLLLGAEVFNAAGVHKHLPLAARTTKLLLPDAFETGLD